MQAVLPRHLRPRREKIFGPAPEHRLDGNAKARLWAAANAYNSANRAGRQHQGPLTWTTLRVLRTLLWRFHNADGGGRCFPSYEKIAAAAKCCRDSVCVAIAALEDAGLLTWVHRLTRIRRREQDLFGHWGSVWQVIRSSNGYRLLDPLDRQPGRRVWVCKSENPVRSQNREKKKERARPNGTQLIQETQPKPPSVPTEPPAIALQREHAAPSGTLLSDGERAALLARLDNRPTKAEWALYDRDLAARIELSAMSPTDAAG
jgi:helix-turn-helix protein